MNAKVPYYQHAGITIYHADCIDVMAHLYLQATADGPLVDLVLSDPPYGMAWNTDSTRFSGGNRPSARGRDDWGAVIGDDVPFDPSPWLDYPKVILWGANHYAQRLPVGTTLVWVKKQPHLYGTFLSDAEIGWQKGGHGVYAFHKNFPPPSRMAEGEGQCLHPTQKPLALMTWCLERSNLPINPLILDPYMGSGTTLRAAKNKGYRAIGCEIEERYCEAAAKRLQQDSLFGDEDW